MIKCTVLSLSKRTRILFICISTNAADAKFCLQRTLYFPAGC